MPFIIDGHNLIPRIPGLSLATVDDEHQLVRRLQAFCRKTGKRVEVYFDNAPPDQAGRKSFGMVTAHFVQQGRSADAAIQTRLSSLRRNAPNWTVVSSDREVARFARQVGAKSQSAEQFARSLIGYKSTEDQEANHATELNEAEVEKWLQIFGEEGETK